MIILFIHFRFKIRPLLEFQLRDLVNLDGNRVISFLELYWFDLFLKALENNPESRNDKQQNQRAYQHSAHSTGSERPVAIRSDTGREHQREHTEHHRQGRHQDRTEAVLGRSDGRLLERHSAPAAFPGIVSYQDCGLCKQADQHNQSGLQVDVVLQSEHLGEQEAAHKSARDRQDDCERKDKALIHPAENQIDEQDADREDDGDVVAGRCLLTGDSAELKAIVAWQDLGGSLTDSVQSVT